MQNITDVVAIDGDIFLKTDGTVWRILPDKSNSDSPQANSSFRQVENLAGILSVKGSVALKKDGTVWSWEENFLRSRGKELPENRSYTAMQIPEITDTIVVFGHSAWFAITRAGDVYSWGYNWEGQLGLGDTEARWVPQRIKGLSAIVDIVDAWDHVLALKKDGTVWAWGANLDGQLGDGTNLDRLTPVQVKGLHDVIAIDGTQGCSFAITK
jgi:alpha-tubulin suppressor-like RCC1 family protein